MTTSVHRSPTNVRHRHSESMRSPPMNPKRSSVDYIQRLHSLAGPNGDLNDVASISIPTITEAADAVTGLKDRVRLQKNEHKSLDTARELLQAYEYLKRVGQAKEWIEQQIAQEIGDILDLEEELRNGITLAEIAAQFSTEKPRIYRGQKLSYRHTDNIVFFLEFLKKIGLPEVFMFETTDLYNKRNIPKVIYCVHATAHFLSSRGLAGRIDGLGGNLIFSEEQLRATQRGLDQAGVPMPNFGNVESALAKELGTSPQKSEEEILYERLMKCVALWVGLQSRSLGVIQRMKYRQQQADQVLSHKDTFTHFQARVSGMIMRKVYEANQAKLVDTLMWVAIMIAALRGMLVRFRFNNLRDAIRKRSQSFEKAVDVAKGVLARARFDHKYIQLQECSGPATGLQSRCLRAIVQRKLKTRCNALQKSSQSWYRLQARIQGTLVRSRLSIRATELDQAVFGVVGIQAHARRFLVRHHLRSLHDKLWDDYVYAESSTVLTAQCEGVLLRHEYKSKIRALKLAEYQLPMLQANIRGFFARSALLELLHHLSKNVDGIIGLQGYILGRLSRHAFLGRLQYFKRNLSKIVKIQSYVRGRQQGQVYKQLNAGKDVTVGTVKKFGYLLEDTDLDLEQEIELQGARRVIVEKIKECSVMEARATDLEIKIGLLVKNKITLDEVIRATKRSDARVSDPYEQMLLGANGAEGMRGDNNEYSLDRLDKASREKLESYQQLFYLLQTEPAYLARLFKELNRGRTSERTKKIVESVVMTLFCYAQQNREEYLMLKLIQRSIHEEMENVVQLSDMQSGNFMFIKLVLHFTRGAQERKYLRGLLGEIVTMIIKDEDLDLEIDPVEIYRALINAEETRSGKPTKKRLVLSAHEALQNAQVRTIFIRHLKQLRDIVDLFLARIFQNLKKLPYGLRYIAREMKRALIVKFPNEDPEKINKIVGNLVYYRYINPALVAPEGFDIVEQIISPMQRKNLAEISKILNMINFGDTFPIDESTMQNMHLRDLNPYVMKASEKFSKFCSQVADIADPEDYFGNYKFVDWTRTTRPTIWITPQEVFWFHQLIARNIDVLSPPKRMDPLREILKELKQPPAISDDLPTVNGQTICLTLTNRAERFARTDSAAELDALMAETKRLVLSVIKVQTGRNLFEILIKSVSEEDEIMWQEVLLEGTLRHERSRSKVARTAQSKELGIGVLDVSTLSYGELKKRTLENILKLEQGKRITREDRYQGLLNAIAIDIRNKHRKGIHRGKELQNMQQTIRNLDSKKTFLNDQIATFNEYIESSMANLQNSKKDKKKFILPFTRQYFHMRELQKQGKVPQFGSYKYTAQQLYERGILLSIEGQSSAAFRSITVTISSDAVGVFNAHADILGMMEVADERMTLDALLDMQFRNQQTVKMFDGMVLLNVNLLLFLITKKFYA